MRKAKDTACKQQVQGDISQQSGDDDVTISAEAVALEADKDGDCNMPIKVDSEQSDPVKEPDSDVALEPSRSQRQEANREDSPLIRTPSPPPNRQRPATSEGLPNATLSEKQRIAQSSASRNPSTADRPWTPKLKHLLRPKSQKEIELWKQYSWCRKTPFPTDVEANQTNPLSPEVGHSASPSPIQQDSAINHPSTRAEDDPTPPSQLADQAKAYIQAYKETLRAQNKASAERMRLKKAGLPHDHFVAPRFGDVLKSRGIKQTA
ncbi:uncharacterized protein SPSC_00982 [Sporisorium scitamineum]|uniref:Uncharacterized protein n=1 Tax=Sporisorium scitamineum TaxID=49012 RepID=A0A0F7S843_9BASI|nr:uncharacterized protein SPSC_00982 [Sporisorium scitamineum]CDW99092.1 hypothetical protein [Sporisorium scitamineum]